MAERQEEGRAGVPAIIRRGRLFLYVLLLAAVLVTLFGAPAVEQAVREGRAPRFLLVAPPLLLATFIVLFALYRFALVRAGRYNAGKAFVQVGLMVLVLSLAVPGSLERWRAAGTVRSVDLGRYMSSPDAEARAMAAELARHRDRTAALRYVPRLLDLLDDPSPEVRRQARTSLTELAGADEGGDGPDAPRRWRDWWKRQGPARR